jgi:glycosyltransferase involved in cell wall biosynthesis
VKLSIIVVCYNMRREIPRTLRSLQRDYQQDGATLDYEVLVIENGSSDPLKPGSVERFGDNFHHAYLADAPPSPAYAVNEGVRRSSGDILCIMVDGAHLLSPGVLANARRVFRAYEHAVVATRYFFLGPGQQNDTILRGYNQAREDALLEQIHWPEDGYRLFQISSPLRFPGERQSTWFNKIIESNCLFMTRNTYADIGGCDERFTTPGGGFMNIDLFKRAAEHPASTLVLLIGEGSFHQVHGGTTTNVTPEHRDAEVARYGQQYEAIRGKPFSATSAPFHYFGHLPNEASKIHRRRYDE